MKRLNIFVDETGEFGFDKGASELYGVSFTFHEQDDDITPETPTIEINGELKKVEVDFEALKDEILDNLRHNKHKLFQMRMVAFRQWI